MTLNKLDKYFLSLKLGEIPFLGIFPYLKKLQNFRNRLSKKKFLLAKNCISNIWIPLKGVKMKRRIITKKYAVDSAIQFAKEKSILRHMVLT